jgi:hypothetical protein
MPQVELVQVKVDMDQRVQQVELLVTQAQTIILVQVVLLKVEMVVQVL